MQHSHVKYKKKLLKKILCSLSACACIKKINNKCCLELITVTCGVSTDEVALKLALISIVIWAYAFAVLKELTGILADFILSMVTQ